jgi:toxin-antitoxin system PIN domain toxin
LILIDANLLIYARVSSLPQHRAARQWLDARLSEVARVGMPWASLLSFLRLVTNSRVFQKPDNLADAWAQVEAWLDCENVWIPQPAEGHRTILRRMLEASGGANLFPDAHLAALAVEHGLMLCTTDGDFARFPDLRWTNPLREGRPGRK